MYLQSTQLHEHSFVIIISFTLLPLLCFRASMITTEAISFIDTGVSRSVHHLCMTPCIIWHANKIFHDQYVRKCGIFIKFTEIIDCKFLQYAVLDN